MKLYLARHTESIWNVNHTCNSDPSISVKLTKKGLKQAKQLAESLKDADFEFVYTSQLGRTKETADIINKSHRAPVLVDPRLNDTKTGFEGRPFSEYKKALDAKPDKWYAVFNDGESLYQVHHRVSKFLEDLKNSGRESVLVVTHGEVIKAMHAVINDLSQDETEDFEIAQGEYKLYELV